MGKKYEGLEVTICGLTFIVDGWLHDGDRGDRDNPPEEDWFEVEIDSIEVKGQPEADAETLLESIKLRVRVSGTRNMVSFDNGFDLIDEEINENLHKYLGV